MLLRVKKNFSHVSHLRAWSGKAVYADAAGRAIIPSESEPMSDDAEIPVATEEVVPRSAAAERMRQHRERRRQGLRCLMIELRETEIDALVGMGLLKAEMRDDAEAVSVALYEHLSRTLGAIVTRNANWLKMGLRKARKISRPRKITVHTAARGSTSRTRKAASSSLRSSRAISPLVPLSRHPAGGLSHQD